MQFYRMGKVSEVLGRISEAATISLFKSRHGAARHKRRYQIKIRRDELYKCTKKRTRRARVADHHSRKWKLDQDICTGQRPQLLAMSTTKFRVTSISPLKVVGLPKQYSANLSHISSMFYIMFNHRIK